MRAVPVGVDQLSGFIELTWQLAGEDPHFVPPLRAQLELELGGRSAFFRHGRLQMFQCGHLGRIAALIDPRLTDESGTPIGMVGYFECVDDERVAAALMDSSFAWLSSRGARRALGPMNGGAHRLHRLLVRGFDRAPFLFEPRNPAYYPRLFAACGFAPVHRWYSYEFDRAEVVTLQRRVETAVRLSNRVADLPFSGRIELLAPRDTSSTLLRLHALLDGLWQGHVGYSSLDIEEFSEVFAGVLPLLGPRHVGALVEDEKDVGCGLVYPDYVAEVRALAGDVSRWASWVADAAPASRLIMHTLALTPKARGTAGALLLLEQGLRQFLEDGHEQLLMALAVEGLRLFGQGTQPTREYALYGRAL